MSQNYRREPLWYKDAIIYELNIKGFYDSNGDGIGDFAGLEQRLDYLEELGITAIWLLPFYPSPLRDDGYDIQDYYNVSSPYGNIADFKRFLDAAHARNLQVITELVINHTSDQHPWFQRARRAPEGSPERNYYVWSDDDQKWPDVRIIFTDTETSNWTWDPVAKQYYWHRFFSHQPDLNYDSEDVQREIFAVLDYWMNMGIDGFRLDAIPYLFEREGTNGENLPETHAFLKKLRKHVDDNYDNVLFLAEANMWPEDSASYFGDGDECHMNYHFPLMPRMYMSVKVENRHPITDIFDQTPAIPPNCQWATFLRNHDELTLEMVTEEERDFMYNTYAADRTARINVGIRRRLAPLMDNDRNKIELLNVLLLSLPGTPVLYYGDEIGMGDNFYLKDRDGVRTPMQWNNEENAGFSTANPHSLYLPVIRDTEYSYRWINVKRQQQTPNSLLNWTKRLLAKRRNFRVFGRGTIHWLKPENGHVLAFVREYEEERVAVVINLSRHPQAVELDLSDYAGSRVREVFGQTHFRDVDHDPYVVTMVGHGYFWLQLESAANSGQDHRQLTGPALTAASVEALFSRANLRTLEKEVLPAYLRSVSWMGNKAAELESVTILDYVSPVLGGGLSGWVFLSVGFLKGLPEMIQLPLVLHPAAEDAAYGTREEVVCLATVDGQTMVVSDALYDENFRAALLHGIPDLAPESGLVFTGHDDLRHASGQELRLLHSGTEYQLLQSKDYNVKFYRRIHDADVPDLEVKRILNQRGFGSAPQLAGSLHFAPRKGMNATLAIFENRTAGEGSSWDYVRNNLQRYGEDIVTRLQQLEDSAPDPVAATEEVMYRDMPETIRLTLGAPFIARVADLGRTFAAFHSLMYEANGDKSFAPEPLSLHYQRSVYAGLKGEVRSTIDLIKQRLAELDEEGTGLAEALIAQEDRIHEVLKRIFDHKIESDKIRIHGDFTLEQISLTEDGFVIHNFDGDPDRSFSQRTLRRSPAKDLANLMRSISYAAGLVYEDLSLNLRQENADRLEDWLLSAERYLSAEFLTAYRSATEGTRLLPADEKDLEVLLDAFRIEKALQELRYDLHYRVDQAKVPLRGLLAVLAE
ncbi:maltose alpha-D-glucosyltransferase [Neolewinella lacunae]|uniref:maltose alpha-D-glucosyltransferase n=1 Tax=Neolewinella lacunae TaxID=1517758 RepID=A0A923PKB4_9BACT|nr:maltose alpha-D-glucosyltransferase [Neolewinella lacunae]MBC6995708.1 maltose alpha-D-glucosyltransferase [Neolewinella lacunae]MDN3636599.1 maltose alpha-D-glucosyltransferase [Neolewinella lacunae]